MENLVFYTYLKVGLQPTVKILDAMKELGFTYATRPASLWASTTSSSPARRKPSSKRPKRPSKGSRSNIRTGSSLRASGSTASSRSGARSRKASRKP